MANKTFHHLDSIIALFVAVLLISNVASSKILDLGPFTFDGGTVLFPLSYIFGDIITEVYGYRRARKAIWLGFVSAFLMAIVFITVGLLPAASGWENQDAYEKILGLTPRIVVASLVAFWCGSFANAYILAKIKILTKGRWLWLRTISSTVVGEFLDTLLFILIAFAGVLPTSLLVTLVVSNYIFKTVVEVALTPLTYKVVAYLKKTEGEDVYDANTNFNPFKSV